MGDMKREKLLDSESEGTMDAIRMRAGVVTDGNSLDNLLEVFQLDIQDTHTARNNILRVGDRQYRFKESTLITYHIYVAEEKQEATNITRNNDIIEFISNQDWIAIKLTAKGRKGAKVDCKQFVHELISSLLADTLRVTSAPNPKTETKTKTKRFSPFPQQITSKGVLKKISNLLKRAEHQTSWTHVEIGNLDMHRSVFFDPTNYLCLL